MLKQEKAGELFFSIKDVMKRFSINSISLKSPLQKKNIISFKFLLIKLKSALCFNCWKRKRKMPYIIETHQLTKAYGSLKAVDKLDITVESAKSSGCLDLTVREKPQPYQCFARFFSRPLEMPQLTVMILSRKQTKYGNQSA